MARKSSIDRDEMAGAVVIDDSGVIPMVDVDVSDDSEVFEQFRESGESETAGKVIWVYRIPTDSKNNPTGEESRHLFSAPIDRYDLPQLYDRIKKEYMPRGYGVGTFRILVRTAGQRGVHWKKLLVLEKGAHDDEPEVTTESSSGNNIAAVAQLFQKTLDDAMRANRDLIGQLLARQNAVPAIDPIQQALQLTAAISGMVTAVNSKQTLIGAATGGAVDTLGSIKEMFGFLKSIGVKIGTGDGDARDDGDDNSLSKMLEVGKPYVELLGKMIERAPVAPVPGARRTPPDAVQPQLTGPAANATGGASPARAMPPASAPAPSAPIFEPTIIHGTGGSGTAEGTDPMLLELAKHVSDICTLLDRGQGEPAGVAKLILDSVPAKYDEKFYAIIADESWLLKLASLDRRVNNHAEFFGQVRALILAEFADDTESETPDALD